MKKITFSDVKNVYEYEKIREDFRKKIIEIKKTRRISVGPHLMFTFENRETVLFQIQEMIRVERLLTDEAMQSEIDVYNQLIPGARELSATLLIEITEQSEVRPILDSLVGLGHNSVFLKIGAHEIPTIFDEAQSAEDRISAVQYVKWKLSDEDIRTMNDFSQKASIVIQHKNYQYETLFENEQRSAICHDLLEL